MDFSYTIADLKITPHLHTVTRNGRRVEIPDLSFKLFLTLLETAPNILSIEDLAQSVWGRAFVSEETISQRISLLRRALEDDSKTPKYIRTIRSQGYCTASPVHKNPIVDEQYKPRLNKKIAAICIGIIVLAGGFILRTNLILSKKPHATSQQSQRTDTQIAINRAIALFQVQQAEETNIGIQILRKASKIDNASLELKLVLSVGLSTRATKFQSNDTDELEAEKLARYVLSKTPDKDSPWHALGFALDAQGNVDQALAAYKRAYEINPQNTNAISSAAHLFGIRGRLHEALQLEARGINNGGSGRYVEIQIGRILDLLSLHEAQIWYDKAERLNPGQVVVIGAIATRAFLSEDSKEALQIIAALPQKDQNTPRLINLKGRAELSLGNTDAARETFTKGGENSELYLTALNAKEGYITSTTKKIIKEAENAFHAGDSWPEYRLQLAELKAALGQDADAIKLITQAVDLGWRNAAFVTTSPFLNHLVNHPDWKLIQKRLSQELEAQRHLIINDPHLPIILMLKTNGDTSP